jgi:hypothetical protein
MLLMPFSYFFAVRTLPILFLLARCSLGRYTCCHEFAPLPWSLSLGPHLLCLALTSLPTQLSAQKFTRLTQLPAPKVVESSEMYPGGAYNPANLVDGELRTEYSSNGKGTNTFVRFEFASPQTITAFRHIDRNDPATIAASELACFDAAGNEVQRARVQHENVRAGSAFISFPEPITARACAGRW